MPAHPVVLQSRRFETKTEANSFFKSMLHKYSDGDEISPEDSRYLFELIQRHPEDKIGVGIKRFYRDKSDSHPTSCFHIERYDGGDPTDFSFRTCVSGKEPTLETSFYRACRESVTPLLFSQKLEIFKNGDVTCFKTGEVVSIRESEYRHTIPKFQDIVKNFILKNNIEITASMLTESRDMQYTTEFSDSSMTSKFIEFHSGVANLNIFKKNER